MLETDIRAFDRPEGGQRVGIKDEARATLEEFLKVAESDMALFPGRRLKNWEASCLGTSQMLAT
jgi:hypothetical protein